MPLLKSILKVVAPLFLLIGAYYWYSEGLTWTTRMFLLLGIMAAVNAYGKAILGKSQFG